MSLHKSRRRQYKHSSSRNLGTNNTVDDICSSWCTGRYELTLPQCLELAKRTMEKCEIIPSCYRVYGPYLIHLLRVAWKEPRRRGVFADANLDKNTCSRLRRILVNEKKHPFTCPLFKRERLRETLNDIARKNIRLYRPVFLSIKETTIEDVDRVLGNNGMWVERTLFSTFARENNMQEYGVYETPYNSDKLLDIFHSIKTVDEYYPGNEILTRSLILYTYDKIFLAIRRDIFSLIRMYWLPCFRSPCRSWPIVVHNYFTSNGSHKGIRDSMDHCVFNYILSMAGIGKDKVKMHLVRPGSPDFELYSSLPIILSAYESMAQMDEDFVAEGQPHGFKRQSILEAVVSFLCIEDEHRMAPADAYSILCRMQKVYTEKEQFEIQELKPDCLGELMRIMKLCVPDSLDVCNTAVWVDHRMMYELCASGLLHPEDVRTLFLSMKVELKPGDKPYSYFSENRRRGTTKKSTSELRNRVFSRREHSIADHGGIEIRNDILTFEKQYVVLGKEIIPRKDMRLEEATSIVRARPMCWFMNCIENLFLGYCKQRCMYNWPKHVDLDLLVNGTKLSFFSRGKGEGLSFESMIPTRNSSAKETPNHVDVYGFSFPYLFLYPNLLKHIFYRRDYEKGAVSSDSESSDSCVPSVPMLEKKGFGADLSSVSSFPSVGVMELRGSSSIFDVVMGSTYFPSSSTMPLFGAKRKHMSDSIGKGEKRRRESIQSLKFFT